MLASSRYECRNPPCLHVVVDYRRKLFAIYLETSDGELIHIPFDRVEKAYQKASSLLSKRFREATGKDIDYLAQEYLEAEPIEFEEV